MSVCTDGEKPIKSTLSSALALFFAFRKNTLFLRNISRQGAPVPKKTFPEIRSPLGAAKPTTPQDFCTAKWKSRSGPRTFLRRSAKADNAAGLSLGEVRKPTTPQDFPSAKCESRPPRRTSSWRSGKADHAARTFSRRSAKADNDGRLCPGGLFRPRGRPERRASL